MDFRPGPPKYYRGSTTSDVAVRFLGRDSAGNADLQLNVRVPETPDDDPNATDRQLNAIAAFFPHIPSTISFGQAHALLCYRDYAQAVVDRVLPEQNGESRKMWIAVIATLVSHDDRVAKDVCSWSDDRFRRARLDSTVIRTKHFNDLMIVCRDLAKDMDLL